MTWWKVLLSCFRVQLLVAQTILLLQWKANYSISDCLTTLCKLDITFVMLSVFFWDVFCGELVGPVYLTVSAIKLTQGVFMCLVYANTRACFKSWVAWICSFAFPIVKPLSVWKKRQCLWPEETQYLYLWETSGINLQRVQHFLAHCWTLHMLKATLCLWPECISYTLYIIILVLFWELRGKGVVLLEPPSAIWHFYLKHAIYSGRGLRCRFEYVTSYLPRPFVSMSPKWKTFDLLALGLRVYPPWSMIFWNSNWQSPDLVKLLRF